MFRSVEPDPASDRRAYRRGHRTAIDPEDLRRYDEFQARQKHLAAVQEFLDVKPFGATGQALLREAVNDAAMTKEDVADIVNVEMLVRNLPAFDTL